MVAALSCDGGQTIGGCVPLQTADGDDTSRGTTANVQNAIPLDQRRQIVRYRLGLRNEIGAVPEDPQVGEDINQPTPPVEPTNPGQRGSPLFNLGPHGDKRIPCERGVLLLSRYSTEVREKQRDPRNSPVKVQSGWTDRPETVTLEIQADPGHIRLSAQSKRF